MKNLLLPLLEKLSVFIIKYLFIIIFFILCVFKSYEAGFAFALMMIIFFILKFISYYSITKIFANKCIGVSIKAYKNIGNDKKETFRFESRKIKWYKNQNRELFNLQASLIKEIQESYEDGFIIEKVEYIKD